MYPIRDALRRELDLLKIKAAGWRCWAGLRGENFVGVYTRCGPPFETGAGLRAGEAAPLPLHGDGKPADAVNSSRE